MTTTEPWMESASCASVDPHLFHAIDVYQRRRAVAVCGGCPVVDDCRAYRDQLIADGARLFGVWCGVDLGMDDGLTRWAQEVAA